MSRPLPDSCALDRIERDWCAAVDAYRNGDPSGVADALCPPDLGSVETYTRLFALTALAAHVCGQQYRKVHKVDPDPDRDGAFFGVEVVDAVTDRVVTPDDGIKEANVVAAGRLIAAAANGDVEMVTDLVHAHMPFEGSHERSGVLLDLLGIYCAMSSAAAEGVE
ncbi:hypothetical protein [Pseudonocardia asaccharolytica]|uniref:Uncharacterized protein n=1 Tax=Pseudonocardia asaccharolytica DSM 44247 = NBRC 16224 TaxID=1123024 RepID=A0A511D4A0_9PSEU|nr:hypothetical protein [Pseudonocardia asaccharolytica]GEL19303.1 hypothetical protein PA7_31400 [Pseudonocardia asaccharolytica DSM 44247 = NBRC 16224]